VFIALCFLALIIGIGVYPKMAMQMYDVKTVAVNAQVRQSYTQIAEMNPQIYAEGFLVPKVAESEVTPVLGIVERFPK
jgi:NAD(P)H-quinone oxidoreductase subunit 4